jgi:hypothetical protein
MSAPNRHQRVYRNKGNHRRIGMITDVAGDEVCVLWSGATKASALVPYHGLTVVTVRNGATVILTTAAAQPFTARFPLFGIVSNVNEDSGGNETCTVTWDDRTVTTLQTLDVTDINWLPPVSLNDLTLQDWLKAFEIAHNIDFATVRAGTYRCSRNSRVSDCLCHSEVRKCQTHSILPSCMCQFRIDVLGNTVQFSGTHIHHIPGTSRTHSN